MLCRELELSEADVTTIDGPLDLVALWALYCTRPARPQGRGLGAADAGRARGRRDAPPDFFRLLQTSDVLVHHPYDSFTTSVEQFVEQAASDPAVLAIKQTIYRTAGPESAIVRSLIKAAEQGKQVVALVELTARFDEQANIERARVLEEAGVHVVYGLVGLKTHAKVLLVVRQEADGIRRYCHIGTGNYNGKTANTYEDLGLAHRRPRPRRRPHRPLQPPHRLQPSGLLPQAARRAVARAPSDASIASSVKRRRARAVASR